jgi:hypothetical protein
MGRVVLEAEGDAPNGYAILVIKMWTAIEARDSGARRVSGR